MFGKKNRDDLDEVTVLHEKTMEAVNNEKARIDVLKKEAGEIEKHLEVEREKKEALDADVESTKGVLDAMRAESEGKVLAYQEDIHAKKLELEKLTKEGEEDLEAAKFELDTVKKTVTTLENKAAKLEKAGDKIAEENEKLSTEKENLKTEVEGIKSEKKTLKESVVIIGEGLVAAEKQLEVVTTRAKEDAELSLRRVAEKEAAVEVLKEEEVDLQAAIVDLKKQKKELSSEVKKLEDSKSEIEKRASDVHKEGIEVRKHAAHVTLKEEHVRNSFNEIGMAYEEFKG